MALYNISSFMKLIKQDAEIVDIPLPASDAELLERFKTSALIDFSIHAPRVENCRLNETHIVVRSQDNPLHYNEYQIPYFVYQEATVLNVSRFDIVRPNGYANFYTPQIGWSTPDTIISAMGDLRMAAGVASAMGRALTFEFRAPDRIRVYNGWYSGTYEAEILLSHDPSLATIQPGTFPNLRKLAVLDMKAYLYGLLKRKDGLDTGLGTYNLKIDDWASAAADRQALLDSWGEESNLDVDHITYF